MWHTCVRCGATGVPTTWVSAYIDPETYRNAAYIAVHGWNVPPKWLCQRCIDRLGLSRYLDTPKDRRPARRRGGVPHVPGERSLDAALRLLEESE